MAKLFPVLVYEHAEKVTYLFISSLSFYLTFPFSTSTFVSFASLPLSRESLDTPMPPRIEREVHTDGTMIYIISYSVLYFYIIFVYFILSLLLYFIF